MAKMITHHPIDAGGGGEHQVHFVRLNKHERIQHTVLMISFFLLVVTGFTLRLPEHWMQRLGETAFNYEVRSLVHRGAGIAMIFICMSHVIYVLTVSDGRSWVRDMWPRWRDLREMRQNLAHCLGLRRDPPRFDRFNYKEKMEYWALVVGSTLMSVTGLVMMYEYLWGQLALEISALIHRMEAILASLAIIIWHLYEVHLRPGKFPHSLVWWTGMMDEEEMREEHPALHDRLVKSTEKTPSRIVSHR